MTPNERRLQALNTEIANMEEQIAGGERNFLLLDELDRAHNERQEIVEAMRRTGEDA